MGAMGEIGVCLCHSGNKKCLDTEEDNYFIQYYLEIVFTNGKNCVIVKLFLRGRVHVKREF